jgi:predicted transglutaminase-like cysteine proteinase
MNINSIQTRTYPLSSFIDITPLLPTTPTSPNSIVDILPKSNSLINNLLTNILNIRFAVQWSPNVESDSGENYQRYLQYPNSIVSALASTIVSPADSNDTKMYKIEQWVQDNITYVSDTENYGLDELWAYPTMTIKKKTGDCEDGAFLMHSLALAAGIPYDRLRTYGGLVYADSYGLSTGGHAWTSYKRETDNEWVICDWCYWADDVAIADKDSMSEDLRYIDDYFYVNATATVETPYDNRVRYAQYASTNKGATYNNYM